MGEQHGIAEKESGILHQSFPRGDAEHHLPIHRKLLPKQKNEHGSPE